MSHLSNPIAKLNPIAMVGRLNNLVKQMILQLILVKTILYLCYKSMIQPILETNPT